MGDESRERGWECVMLSYKLKPDIILDTMREIGNRELNIWN